MLVTQLEEIFVAFPETHLSALILIPCNLVKDAEVGNFFFRIEIFTNLPQKLSLDLVEPRIALKVYHLIIKLIVRVQPKQKLLLI